MNELIWLVALLVSFGGVLIFYKLMGKVGLYIWIAIAIIAANIQAVKLVNLFSLETALGAIIYSTIFLVINILNERFGKKEAEKGILIGAVSMLMMTILMGLSVLYNPSNSDFANESLRLIFSINLRITVGSLLAYLVSQYCNVMIYQKLKKKYRELWVRSSGGTIIAQFIDTVIFTAIAFTGVFSFGVLTGLFISRFIFKLIITLLSTPVMYKAVKMEVNKF